MGLSVVAGVLITATVTPAIAVSGAAASSAIKIFDNMPSYLEIDELMLPTTIYTNGGDAGWVELTSFYDQNRSPVAFDEINPVAYDAILSSEDPRYYQHGGVDLIGTTRALLSNAQGGATQGGSSISQQYVKNVLIQRCERDAQAETVTADDGTVTTVKTRDEALQSCWLEATQASGVDGYERKLQEMRYAIQLEKEYSKDEILLGYLNIANFGGTTYGIDAAARYYFNVSAADLSVGQAATLAGIVQNPNTYRIDQPNNESNGAANGYAQTKTRQTYVLGRMLEDGKITQEQHDAAVAEPITPAITPAQTGCAATGATAYFCQYVVSVVRNDPAFGAESADRERALKQGGLNIYTTLDWRVQSAAQDAMAEYAPESVPGTSYGSTSVSVEATTGRVLAIAQNTKFTEDSNLAASDPAYSSIVYAGTQKNGGSDGFSAGSTFKLFTLIDWLEKGHSVNESVNGRDVPISRFTNSCTGNIVGNTWKPGNFGGGGGGYGTPMSFTAQSLNSGYVAMASQLDLCDIGKVAARMGVMGSNGEPIEVEYPTQIIGPSAVSPMAMAGAYGTVANNGVYCQPKVIDRVTNSKGEELPIPETTCEQVISPEVAATAAYALQGVMTGGGTGARANTGDGTALIGKTGTHQEWQTWMVESSSKVATAVWAGNANGTLDVFKNSYRGIGLQNIRYYIAQDVQRAANAAYGGDAFPRPDNNLVRQVLRDVPNVVGQTIDQAQSTLEAAGFSVQVGDPIDSDQPTNIVAGQSANRAASGASITISPSNGQATTIPSVAGSAPAQAVATLQAAGFTQLSGSCTVDPAAPDAGLVSGTNPGAGSVASRSTAIAIAYTAKAC
ncbi:transglycosylase domain-containing protein [Microbacterium hatanonis]